MHHDCDIQHVKGQMPRIKEIAIVLALKHHPPKMNQLYFVLNIYFYVYLQYPYLYGCTIQNHPNTVYCMMGLKWVCLKMKNG